MLLACSVDTPIHINRSHLLASHCASRPASCVDCASGICGKAVFVLTIQVPVVDNFFFQTIQKRMESHILKQLFFFPLKEFIRRDRQKITRQTSRLQKTKFHTNFICSRPIFQLLCSVLWSTYNTEHSELFFCFWLLLVSRSDSWICLTKGRTNPIVPVQVKPQDALVL